MDVRFFRVVIFDECGLFPCIEGWGGSFNLGSVGAVL